MDQDPTVNAIPLEPAPERKRHWDDAVYEWWAPKWRKIRGPFWVLFFITLFVIVWLFNQIFVNIYPGNAGVMWRRFSGGTDLTRVYGGGLWVVNPFNKLYIYETRLQQRETDFTALTSNGLTIHIRASVRFRPQIKDLPRLHEEVGPEYVDRVVIPQVQAVIRKIIGAYEPDQIYGSQGNILQNVVLTAMAELRARYIELDDLLIREIQLPEKVANAIENKLEQEQLALQFVYVLDRERQEAERKKIEAEGIRSFQEIVSKDLDQKYLQLRGIEATLELARSSNAKIVVFGNNANGLPLIFNTGDSLSATTGHPAPLANATAALSAGGTHEPGFAPVPLRVPAPSTPPVEPLPKAPPPPIPAAKAVEKPAATPPPASH